MLKWVILAAGAVLTLWGAWWGWTGWSIVEVERGWSAVISGAAIFTAGTVTFAIGLACWHVERIAADMRAFLARTLVPAAAPSFLPETTPAATLVPARPDAPSGLSAAPVVAAAAAGVAIAKGVAAAKVLPDTIAAAPDKAPEEPINDDQPELPLTQPPSRDQAAAEKPAMAQDVLAPDVAARAAVDDALKAVQETQESLAARLQPQESGPGDAKSAPPPPDIPSLPRMSLPRPRAPVQFRVIDGDGPDVTTLSDATAADTPDANPSEANPSEANQSEARQSGTRPAELRPLPPLAPAPARADWPAPPPGKLPPSPRMPPAAVPTALVPAMAASLVPPPVPVVSADVSAPDVSAPSPAAENAPQSALDKFLEEFDIAPPHAEPARQPENTAAGQAAIQAQDLAETSAVEPSGSATSNVDETVSAQIEAAETNPATTVPQIPNEPEPESAPPLPEPAGYSEVLEVADNIAPDAMPDVPAETRTLVREYESQGIKYFLFDDGSVDAHAPSGVFRFASLEELRAYIEDRNRS